DGSAIPEQFADWAAPSDLADLAGWPWITAIATVSDYTPLPGDDNPLAALDSVRTESRHLVRNGAATCIGRTWFIHTVGTDAAGRAFATVKTIRACSPSAALDDPGNAVSTSTRFDADAPGIPLLLRGRPLESTDEDGVTTACDYALGDYDPATRTFTPGGSETALRTVVTQTHHSSLATHHFPTQSETIQDAAHGTTLYSATLLQSTGATLDWRAHAYDDRNRLRSTLHSDGSTSTNAHSCCRLLWTQDRNGFKTLRSAETGKDHLYYAIEEVSLREITERASAFPPFASGFRVTQHFMDALGRETNTVVRTSLDEGAAAIPTFSGPPIPCFTETTLYPHGTSDYSVQTDRLGVRTLSATMASAQCETTVTQTFSPTNYVTPSTVSTNIWHRNGHSISEQHWEGQWTRESQFADYDEEGRRFDISVTEASDYTIPVTNRISRYDFLGRTVLTVTPTGTASNVYDGATSRLVSTTSSTPSTSSTTTFLYNDLGDQVGALKHGIADESETRYESIDSEIWRVTTQSRTVGGATCGVSVVRSQMTGLSNSLRSRTVSTAANGMTSVSASSFDPDTKILATTMQTGDATPSTTLSKYGVVIETQNRSARTLYYHDAFLLPHQVWTCNPGDELLTLRHLGEIDERTWQPLSTVTRLGETEDWIHEETTYDAFGQVETKTDDLGNSTTLAYDVFGRTVAVSGAAYPVRYGYDTMGRMKEMRTTRNGSSFDATRWLYNPATGLVTNKLHADGSSIAYAYTDDGKPLRTTWARDAWKENVYGSDGLLVGVSYSDATPSVFMAYNDLRHLVAASNSVARYACLHTNLGIATNETASIAGSSHVIARGLDEHQRLRQLTVDGGVSATYSYDNENRLSEVSNAVFSVAYRDTSDGHDAGYSVALTNGVVLARDLTRDPYRRSLVTAITNTVNGTATAPLVYDYDTLARVTSRNADTFDYNARSEVTAASVQSNAFTYAYDSIGNHTVATVNSDTTTYTANSLNQYATIDTITPSYDADGNMTWDGRFRYAYDAENRLIAAYSNNVCVVSNAYDHMSRRVVKWTPSHTTTFVYDGWNLVQETVQTAQSTVTNRFVWGRDLSGTLQGAGGVGGLLAVWMDETWHFPLYDNNGNISAYVNEQGVIVAEYVYDAYGGTIAQSGSMADALAHRFSTKYYDAETGLYYYGYRFYDPAMHRWLNRDPVGEKGGSNLYMFVKNAPIQSFDLFGLATIEFVKQFEYKSKPMLMELHVLAKDIAEGCELNFIQLTRKSTEWTVDADPGIPPPNAPFYYDRDWRGQDGRGIDDVYLKPDGSLVFSDQPTATTVFYLFAVERCCTKYYKDHKKCNCCEHSRATVLDRFYWHTVTGKAVVGEVTEERKARMDALLKRLVSNKTFTLIGCEPYLKDIADKDLTWSLYNPGVIQRVEIIFDK
ncbi:MAG: RHS repeat-associated core domain-containing protein, partial [Kiritimatiellia bacterium]